MTTRAALRAQYRSFLRLFFHVVAAQPLLFAGFIVFSLTVALTEGFGVSLLIPLVQSGSSFGTGGRIPWLDTLIALLLPADAAERTVVLAAMLMVVILARGVLQLGASYLSILLPLNVQSRLAQQSYNAVLQTSLDFFTRSDVGVLRTLVLEYPQRLASSIKSITDIIGCALLAGIYVTLMLWVSWWMTLVSIVLVGAAGIAIKRVLTVPLGRTGEAISTWQERWNSLIHQTGVGLKLIRLLGAERMMRTSFQDIVRNFIHHDTVRQMIGEAQTPLLTTIGGLFVCGMLIYGTVVDTGIDVAMLLVLVLCLYRVTAPVSRIMTNLVFINANIDALERQERFSRTMLERPSHDGSCPFAQLERGVEFHDVTFRYPGSERAALANFSLSIRRGKMVALVGPSGAGKTTVVNLLGRLYDPQLGRVEIDGVDLRDYEIAGWRRRIAVVSQDITLFNLTVAENLAFGLESVTREAMEQAATQAAAADFIKDLPEGWDTPLGDRGVRLSGGQQQRLSLARAILRNPDLLVLDEATSQLDALTEVTVQHMLQSWRGERTMLVVAHRFSTIRQADAIAVMRDGRIVEQGTHAELAARDSEYRRMLDAQQLGLVMDIVEQRAG